MSDLTTIEARTGEGDASREFPEWHERIAARTLARVPTRTVVAGCVLAALWGCQTVPKPTEKPASPPREAATPAAPERSVEEREREQVSTLIAYFQGIAGLTPDEQRRELALAGQASARDRTLYSRLRLALLLTVPTTGFGDDARAAGLLDPLPPAPAGVAAGSSSQSAAQIAGTIAASASPLRQFANLLYSLISERLREQRRAVQLKEQLDALRAVERSLIERGRR